MEKNKENILRQVFGHKQRFWSLKSSGEINKSSDKWHRLFNASVRLANNYVLPLESNSKKAYVAISPDVLNVANGLRILSIIYDDLL